jgi:hypothetical protein
MLGLFGTVLTQISNSFIAWKNEGGLTSFTTLEGLGHPRSSWSIDTKFPSESTTLAVEDNHESYRNVNFLIMDAHDLLVVVYECAIAPTYYLLCILMTFRSWPDQQIHH